MTTGFEPSTTRELQRHAQTLKGNLIAISNWTEDEAQRAGKRGCPASEEFWLNVFLLVAIEETIMARGMDPRHPCFGPDVLQMVADAQADVLSE